MNLTTVLIIGVILGIFTTDLLHYAANRTLAWAATRIDRHITAALDDDEDDPLEQAWRLTAARRPTA